MKLSIYTGFANGDKAGCEAASGFRRRATVLYEHEKCLDPHRAFRDSGGNFQKDGDGFPPYGAPKIRIPAPATGSLLMLNMEFYGPEWANVRAAMRGFGISAYGSVDAARAALVEFLITAVNEAQTFYDPVGLYGFAPFLGSSDERLAVCNQVSAYMPSLYLASPEQPETLEDREYERDMPDAETIPVLSDQCWHHGLVLPEQWDAILSQAVKYGAKRAIYWRDCSAPESAEQIRRASDAMWAAGRRIGIEII